MIRIEFKLLILSIKRIEKDLKRFKSIKKLTIKFIHQFQVYPH